MLKRPPKVNTVYHLTYPTLVDSILKEGIQCKWDVRGMVYMCPDKDVLEEWVNSPFGRWRTQSVPSDEIIQTEHGPFHVPKYIEHDKVAVIKINTKKLKWRKMHYGDDHNPMFFKGDVYMHEGDIPVEAISGVFYIEFEGGETDGKTSE